MNQQQPQVEERVWSEAELKVFQKKHKAYLEAAAAVNEVIDFLREQHNIDAKDGWQLGERSFIRQRPEPQVMDAPGRTAQPALALEAKRQAKAAKARRHAVVNPVVEPMTSNVNGADIPSEEL